MKTVLRTQNDKKASHEWVHGWALSPHHAPHMNVSSVHLTAGWCSTYMQWSSFANWHKLPQTRFCSPFIIELKGEIGRFNISNRHYRNTKQALSRRKIGTFENQNATFCTSTNYFRRQESVRSAMKMGENSMAEGKKKKKGKDAETFQQPCL